MFRGNLKQSLVFSDPATAPKQDDPRIVTVFRSAAGVAFQINPAFLQAIDSLIAVVRDDIKVARDAGKYVAYVSVPISPRGGGHFDTNTEIARYASAAIEKRFGDSLFIVNPAAFDLPPVGEERAGGGDYMAVWSEVLAGTDATGSDFDMIYFIGPSDVWGFFDAEGPDKLGTISRWIDRRTEEDEKFREYITTGNNRQQFLRYYGLRGSSAYSKGAHDEWNIVMQLNKKRPIGDDIAIYFDGNPIEPGDFDDTTDVGYEIL